MWRAGAYPQMVPLMSTSACAPSFAPGEAWGTEPVPGWAARTPCCTHYSTQNRVPEGASPLFQPSRHQLPRARSIRKSRRSPRQFYSCTVALPAQPVRLHRGPGGRTVSPMKNRPAPTRFPQNRKCSKRAIPFPIMLTTLVRLTRCRTPTYEARHGISPSRIALAHPAPETHLKAI